jgi:lipopolysaccharide/colanic/teichoic acid biosynthesis glycosyltransferase
MHANSFPAPLRATPGWKRALDLLVGSACFLIAAPIVALLCILVWLGDGHNPLFVSARVGRGGRVFRFIKIRTMVPNANRNAVDTTIAGDPRVLPIGKLIRALKFDELPQFWHVLTGEMSLVGPRPNVPREVAIYTPVERGLLGVRPGITDYSSIVFADLGEVLAGAADANIAYNQLVRPWKSRLGLHYVESMTPGGDLRLIMYTVTAILWREWTLGRIARDLERSNAPAELVRFARRHDALVPLPPPGADAPVTSRDGSVPTQRSI